jgi:hypothetical protein
MYVCLTIASPKELSVVSRSLLSSRNNFNLDYECPQVQELARETKSDQKVRR